MWGDPPSDAEIAELKKAAVRSSIVWRSTMMIFGFGVPKPADEGETGQTGPILAGNGGYIRETARALPRQPGPGRPLIYEPDSAQRQ
jgi:hypothetical protein